MLAFQAISTLDVFGRKRTRQTGSKDIRAANSRSEKNFGSRHQQKEDLSERVYSTKQVVHVFRKRKAKILPQQVF